MASLEVRKKFLQKRKIKIHSECSDNNIGKRVKKSYTKEEFSSVLSQINPSIEVITFTKVSKEGEFLCKECGTVWKTRANHLIYEQTGCPICANKRVSKITLQDIKDNILSYNPNIIITNEDKYADLNSILDYQCNICGYKWTTCIKNLYYRHTGCPKCKGVVSISYNDFIQKLQQNYPDIIVIDGEYKGLKSILTFKCIKDNYEWSTRCGHLYYQDSGCPCCNNRKKVTQDDFMNYLQQNLPEVEIVAGDYKNIKSRLTFHCKKDDYIWETACSTIFYQHCGCPKCSNVQRYSFEVFCKNVEYLIDDIEILNKDEFINLKTKLDIKCLKCGKIFSMSGSQLINRHSKCPYCQQRKPISTNEFILEIKNKLPQIEILAGEYKNVQSQFLVKCTKCGNEFYSNPAILRGRIRYGYGGCPCCSTSKGENQIAIFLSSVNISFIRQKRYDDCLDQRSLPFDFYIPQCNLLCEFDRRQHFEPVQFGNISQEQAEENFKIVQKHDAIKNEYCKANNIPLLRIPYWDIEKIPEIIEAKIAELESLQGDVQAL